MDCPVPGPGSRVKRPRIGAAGEISALNPPIPHPENCQLYGKHKSGSMWTLSSAFMKK